MRTAYIYEVATAVALLGVTECYLWTQSRISALEGPTTKATLIITYVVISVISQLAAASAARYRFRDALRMNLLVAAIVSVGMTFLAFSVHPAVLKDEPTGWTSALLASLKFFLTIGLATMVLRIMVAAVFIRAAKS